MDDSFPFPILVEGDWNPGLSKLKNKLTIYFQSKKSNGGECLVQDEASDGQTAVVRFKTEEVRRRVLDKEEHKLKLGKEELRLTVRLPQAEAECTNAPLTSSETIPTTGLCSAPDGSDGSRCSTQNQEESEDVHTVEEEVEMEAEMVTCSVVLGNVSEKMDREMINMLVENISDTSAEQGDFSVEVIPNLCVAVVTFKNSKKVPYFLSMCPSNRTFKKYNLSAEALEVTNTVEAERIPHSISTDHLELYFEREGKEDVEVELLEEEQSALITFCTHKGVNEVLKKQHLLLETPIGVYPYYKSLGTALYGKERPALKLPEAFTERMDPAVWKFLQEKKLFGEISEVMAKCFCKVGLESPDVLISPLPSLLLQKGLHRNPINAWKENAVDSLHRAVSKFQSFECNIVPDVWTESETEIRGALSEAVIIVPHMDRGVVVLAGLAKDVDGQKDVLVYSVGAATEKLKRQRDSMTEEFSVAPSVDRILQEDGLHGKIAAEYPKLKMTYSQERRKMILSGLSAEVFAAKSAFLEQILALKQKVVEVEEHVLAFLCEADREELCSVLFATKGINATYEIEDRKAHLIGRTEQAFYDAENQLQTALGSYTVIVEDQNVLQKREWQDLVRGLKDSLNTPVNTVKFSVTNQAVVVSGFHNSVKEAGKDLLNFMSSNSVVEESIAFNSRAALMFIEDHMRETWSQVLDQNDVKVAFTHVRSPSIELHGPRAQVKEFKSLFENIISCLHFDILKIAKPGAKKHFKEKQDMIVATAATKMRCVIVLEEEDSERPTEVVPSQSTAPQLRLPAEEEQHEVVQTSPGQDRVRTKEGLTIILLKGNIQDATAHVIVNSLGKDLDLNSGAISKSVLQVAGPALQNLVQAEGAKKNCTIGTVLITQACNLKSEHVFHTITPHWNKGKGNTEKILEGMVEECLQRAEELSQLSIAFPAIGSGKLGFPKDYVASMLLGQVLSFSSRKKPRHLREVLILLHPSDTQTCQAFSTEFNKRFRGVSPSLQQPPSPAGSSTQPGQGLFSTVKAISQGHEMKVGGVLFQALTGDITQETTDVIINSSNSDFSLQAGVSKAILDAAGPTVGAECKQLGAQANNGMIMTQPGNLKCKKIIHIAGQTDINLIKGCFKSALQMAAQNKFTSVSFPALGTGQGGVSPAQVSEAMLDALAEVVQQDPGLSLQVVRLVIFQAQMLMDFHSSMKKREGAGTPIMAPTLGVSLFQRMKRFWKGGQREDKKKVKTLRLVEKKFDPVVLHLCGDSQASLENVKRWIQEQFEEELCFQEIEDQAILELSEEDRKNIQELQQRFEVSIRLEEGNQEATICIEGLSRDVLKAAGKIHEILKKARHEQGQMRDAEILSNLVEWQFQQGSQYVPVDRLENLRLEQALNSQQQNVTITIQGRSYNVSLPNGPAVDGQGNQLQIKRVVEQEETKDVPEHWSPMKADQQCLVVPLQSGAQEYNEVLRLFQATCQMQVLKIERIQNPYLWKSLQVLKHSMDHQNGHQNNERRLFHGMSQPTIQHINHRGFNRSYAGKNAAVLGKGTYFAVSASYSAQNTYSVPDGQAVARSVTGPEDRCIHVGRGKRCSRGPDLEGGARSHFLVVAERARLRRSRRARSVVG
ncbi:hypothetical protein GJAV_G00205670 [Gymnothorax javanicus]|nr:hypothetical protein GJAV_G00205670 [Gymnothorax javanicus]